MTLNVTTTSDPTGPGVCLGGGECSLRQAVASAQNGDTIQLGGTSDSPLTYSLTQGTDVEITHNVLLQGNGVDASTIDGSQNSGTNPSGGHARILKVSGATVTIGI